MSVRAISWVWLAPLVLCGCGGSSASHHAHNSRPSRPIWCPTSSSVTSPPPQLYTPNSPAVGSFDTRSLLEHPATRAAAEAAQHGCLWRVVKRDGHNLTITLDARQNRIDAAVDHGIVTATGVY